MPDQPRVVIEMEIDNLLMKGDYTGQIYVGPDRVPANVLLDTGSSTLAMHRRIYKEGGFEPTEWAQRVNYGAGEWHGPVVTTSIGIGAGAAGVEIRRVAAAMIIEDDAAGTDEVFAPADGILGLAYWGLNGARDLGKNTCGGFTPEEYQAGRKIRLSPCFREIEEHGGVADKFSFYTLRSSVHHGTRAPRRDPLNHGYLILGGGEEYTHLYDGRLQAVKVVDDLYYNTNLRSIRVGDRAPIRVDPVSADEPAGSNSIVDTGVDKILLPGAVYEQVAAGLPRETPVTAADLAEWPDIEVVLEGESTDETLTIRPSTYWQLHADAPGNSVLKIEAADAPFVLLGLPLMNNYFTVFDRSAAEGQGLIKFGRIKRPAPCT